MNLDRLLPRSSAELDPSEVSGPYHIILLVVSSLLAQSNLHRVLELDVGELFIDAINELSREFVFDVTCRVFDSFCNILCTCVSAGKLVQ